MIYLIRNLLARRQHEAALAYELELAVKERDRLRLQVADQQVQITALAGMVRLATERLLVERGESVTLKACLARTLGVRERAT